MKPLAARERGATVILVAASMMLLLGIVAIAVDLSALRFDLRADRLASDAASTAGVMAMDVSAGSKADEACQVAWEYLLLNLADSGGSQTPPNCAAVFTGGCDPLTARTAAASAGPYTFTITHPVPDADPLMGGQQVIPQIDGVPCQRLAVTVERVRDHTFARILGFESSQTEVASVARLDPNAGGGEVVPLLVLEPIDCVAIYTSGQGKVTVSYDEKTQTPGFIVVDSNASTCGSSNPYSIDSMGNNKGWIRAIPVPVTELPSAILSFALSGIAPANPGAAFDPNDLTSAVDPADITDPDEPTQSWFRLYPQPVGVSQRITRAPIDWRYNCKTNYPDYPYDLGDPLAGGVAVPDCPETPAPYLDAHLALYGFGVPGGFTNWTTTNSCNVGADISVSGDWYIDCPNGLTINGADVTFTDSNIVLTGGLDLRSTATLEINPGASEDYFVVIRKEGNNGTILKRAQASLSMERTFVYIKDGSIDLRAGSGGLVWTAPESGNFEDLALWSDGAMPHEIGGQAGNTLTGTFFTPFAEPFALNGQGGQVQFEAQFITRRLEVKGQGEVKMTPNPERTTLIPIRAVRLIR